MHFWIGFRIVTNVMPLLSLHANSCASLQVNPYCVEFFLENIEIYLPWIFHHDWNFKSFYEEDKNIFNTHGQYDGCWCPGNDT